jgi:regulator of replication initiation timing
MNLIIEKLNKKEEELEKVIKQIESLKKKKKSLLVDIEQLKLEQERSIKEQVNSHDTVNIIMFYINFFHTFL